jgi:flagellar basal body-associated protein FliL
MNVMDRSFSARAEKAKAELKATRKRRRNLMLGIAAILIVAAAAFYVVWVFTLCGDCSGPVTFPPPT